MKSRIRARKPVGKADAGADQRGSLLVAGGARLGPQTPPALLPVVGWRELVDLPALGLARIPAKIDTGARTSSLHGRVIDQFTKEGQDFVRFSVDWDGIAHECEAVQVDLRGITSSNGKTQKRFVIKSTMLLGEKAFRAEISLADRSDMKFPMLIGRSALRRRFSVDSGYSWLQSSGMQSVKGHKP